MSKTDAEKTMPLTLPVHVQPMAIELHEPGPMQLISQAIQKGITPEGMTILYKLKRDMDADKAKAEYVADYIACQADLEPIVATKTVPLKGGGVKFKYAPWKQIWKQAGPILKRYHFAVSFGSAFVGDRFVTTCTVMHAGGHSTEHPYPIRSSPVQGGEAADADENAITRGRRLSFCLAFNITVEDEAQDARNEGPPITDDQAEKMRQVVQQDLSFTPQRQAIFLEWAAGKGATQFSAIPANRWQECQAQLERDAKKQGVLLEWNK